MKKIFSTIIGAFTGIFNVLIKVIVGIFNAIVSVFKAIASVIVGTYKAFVSTGKKVVNFFKPVYRVTFTMYQVIPGLPVQQNEQVHTFEKGASKEAAAFFDKVVKMTMENKIAPTEVKLKKGKKVIQSKEFGPINDIKKFKIAA